MGPELSPECGQQSVAYNSQHAAGYAQQAEQRRSPLADAERILKADSEHRSLAADQALMLQMVMPTMTYQLNQLAAGFSQWNIHQGFWESYNKGEKIALMHSELSECLEAISNNVPEGSKGCESEELADLFIRLMDYCGYFNINLGAAVHEKMLKNYRRPFKHGKEF